MIMSEAAKNRGKKKTCIKCGAKKSILNSNRLNGGPWKLDKKTEEYPLCYRCYYKNNKRKLKSKARKHRKKHGDRINKNRRKQYKKKDIKAKIIKQVHESYIRHIDKRRKQKRSYNNKPSTKKRRKRYNGSYYTQPHIKKQRNTRERKDRITYRKKWFTLLGGKNFRCSFKGCKFNDYRGLETDHIHVNGKNDRYPDDRSRYIHYKNKPELAKKKYQILCRYHHDIKTFVKDRKSNDSWQKDLFQFLDNTKCRVRGCNLDDPRGLEIDHIHGRKKREKATQKYYEEFLFWNRLKKDKTKAKKTRQIARKKLQTLCGYHHNIKTYLQRQEKIRKLDSEEQKDLKRLK